MRAEDLDPDREIYLIKGIGRIHLGPDCVHLSHADRVVTKVAGVVRGSHSVCLRCAGESKQMREVTTGGKSDALVRLEEMDPEDLGLSPLGER